MKAFHVTLRDEFWERELPGLMPMVREPAEFLWVQPQLTCHLDMQVTQVKSPLGFRPGVEPGFWLLHDLSFPLQVRGLEAPRPSVSAEGYHGARRPCHTRQGSFVPSRTGMPSAPHCSTHGSKRQGRSVERAKMPTPPSSTATPWLTPPRLRLRCFQATTGSRSLGRRGTPACAAASGPVSAATLTRTPRGWTAPADRWAARRRSGPPSARQRARTDAAPCLTSMPPRGLRRKAPASPVPWVPLAPPSPLGALRLAA